MNEKEFDEFFREIFRITERKAWHAYLKAKQITPRNRQPMQNERNMFAACFEIGWLCALNSIKDGTVEK